MIEPLPSTVGTTVYEEVRVEVKPVAEGMAQVGILVEELFRRLDDLAAQVAAERRERVDDLALLTDLISSAWRSVDRRLGRAELVAERATVARSLGPNSRRRNGSHLSTPARQVSRPSSRAVRRVPGRRASTAVRVRR